MDAAGIIHADRSGEFAFVKTPLRCCCKAATQKSKNDINFL